MGVVIALANQKGGVAKTTSAINIAAYLATDGYRVLLVDFDHQGNATLGMGYMPHELDLTIYDAIKALDEGTSFDISRVILPAPHEDPIDELSLIPANLNLSAAEVDMWRMMARESILYRILEPLIRQYDFTILDTPPSLGILTINALYASDYLLIPLSTDAFAISGVPILIQVVNRQKNMMGRAPEVLGYFLTMYERRTSIARAVEEKVRKAFGDLVFKTVIPKNVAAREAVGHGKPLLQYAPDSKAAKAYRELTSEILGRLGHA